MNTRLKISHALFFFGLIFFATACGRTQQNWSGFTQIDDDELYLSYGTYIARIKVATDAEVWTYPPAEERARSTQFYADVIQDGDAIFVGDYSGGVYAVNASDGTPIWTRKVSGTKLLGIANFGGTPDRIVGSVAIGESEIFVPHEDGVFRLDKKTGELLDDWALVTTRSIWSQPLYLPAEGDDFPRLYVSGLDHYLYALNAATGDELWKTDLGGALPGSPVYDAENGIIFIGSFAAEALAVDAETGQILDRFKTNGWVWGEMVLEDSTLYWGDLNGYVYSATFENQKFKERWSRQIDPEGKIRAPLLVAGDLLVAASASGKVYGLNKADGQEIWVNDLQTPVLSRLMRVSALTDEDKVDDLVLVATNDNDRLIIGLRVEDGEQRWAYQHKG